jgi:hypothetical protein
LARLRLDPNPAPVHLNDALGYSESQAGAAFLLGDGIVCLLELLEQLGLIGSRDDTGEVAIKAEANNGAFYVSVRDTGPGIFEMRANRLDFADYSSRQQR